MPSPTGPCPLRLLLTQILQAGCGCMYHTGREFSTFTCSACVSKAACCLDTAIFRICWGNDESPQFGSSEYAWRDDRRRSNILALWGRWTLLTLRHTADIPTSVKVRSENRMGARGKPGQPLLRALYKPSSGHGSFLPRTTIFPLPLI